MTEQLKQLNGHYLLSPMASWQIEGEKVEAVTDLIFRVPKSLRTVTEAVKVKDACSLEGKL